MRLDIQLFADGKVVIETELDTSGFEDGLDDMEQSSALSKFIEGLKDKLAKIGTTMSDAIKKAGSNIGKVGAAIKTALSLLWKGLAKAIVGALAFGTALIAALGIIALLALGFLALVEAAKKVGEENKNLKNDIQYIIFALKTALAPVIDWIANAIKKIIEIAINGVLYLMALVNAIAGKNLFSKATPEAFAKSMKDAEKSSKKTAGHAKEIKKQLAGFDEMNVLQDNKTGGGGGGATNDYKVDFNIADMGEVQSKVDAFVGKVKEAYTTLQEENTWANRKMIQSSDATWGTLKLGWWDLIQGISGLFIGLGELLIGPFLTIIGLFMGIFTGDWTLAITGIKTTIEGFKDFFIGVFQTIAGVVEIVVGAIMGFWVSLWNWFKSKFPILSSWVAGIATSLGELLLNPFKVLWQFIKETINNVKTYFQGLFKVLKGLFTGDWKTMLNGFKDILKSVMNQVWSIVKVPLNLVIGGVNALIKGMNKIKFDVPDWVPGIGGKTLGFNIKEIPKLARGGIINLPGRGTYVGGAIAGEAGKEAVLPLTDAQQMELLGEAIGRYITINASITNTMNGRVISRELQKIQNENAFAGNR